MNKRSFDFIIDHLGWDKVNNISEADIVYSPSELLNSEQYPDKKYIFGPHFSVFPNDLARRISNKCNNSVYIQPSEPSVNTWVNEFGFNNTPVKSFPFPLILSDYTIPTDEKSTVLIYYKERISSELDIVENMLKSRSINYEIIRYGSYQESNYQSKLNKSKYVIWLGRHESQGFALESVMCKNIPLFVWGVTQRNQQLNCDPQFHKVKSVVSTVPYWSDQCGELFFTKEEIESSFDKFLSKLDDYNPRKFVEDNLSIDICSNNLLKLIADIK